MNIRRWVIELEPGVWLADGEGDPPRTLCFKNARRMTRAKMEDALDRIREMPNRRFANLKVEDLLNPTLPL